MCFGPDAAAASRLRWDWQYRRNPNNPGGQPVALGRARRADRSSATTRRCRCVCRSAERDSSRVGQPTRWWRPNAQRQRARRRAVPHLGSQRRCGAWRSDCPSPLRALLKKLHFPDVPPVPGLVKPLTRRAVRLPQWPMAVNRFVSAVTLADRARRRARAAAARRRASRSAASTRRSPSCGSGSPIASSSRCAASRRI